MLGWFSANSFTLMFFVYLASVVCLIALALSVYQLWGQVGVLAARIDGTSTQLAKLAGAEEQRLLHISPVESRGAEAGLKFVRSVVLDATTPKDMKHLRELWLRDA